MACVTMRRGRWHLDYYDNQGKRHVKALPEGTTKGRAKEILREIEDQLAKGIYLPEKKIPAFGEVAQEWLVYKKTRVEDTTWRMYEAHLRLHFEDVIQIKISAVRIADVEKFINARLTEGMNISTLRKLLGTFNQVMSYAVRHRLIESNPVRDAERPKRGKDYGKKIEILNADEIREVLSAADNPKYRMLFHLAIMSGARQGELLGLHWSDIDWKNRQIHIQRTYNHGQFRKPKTKTSDRRIDIGPGVIRELKKWKPQCPPSELVFPTKNGNPISQSGMLRRHFYPALAKAGVKKIRFHDLRHTYASLLIAQGENVKYIQTQMGHSNPTVTLNTYAHLMKPVNQESARRLENAVFERSG